MKKIFIAVIFFAILNNVNAQSLTISETVYYINKTLSDNDSEQRIELLKDGTFKVRHYGIKRTAIMHVSEVELRFWEPTQMEFVCVDLNPTEFIIGGVKRTISKPPSKCPCITFEDQLGKPVGQPFWSEILFLNDPYKMKKLSNAVKYLFELIKEDGSYKRVDDDPFAPQYFNAKRNDIKGDVLNTNIKLENEGGVYHTFVTIGNVKKRFIVDSGASDVTLSEDFERELINTGKIKEDYYISSAPYTLADGSVIFCRRLILPELKLGGYTVNNVKAVIVNNSSPLLLGRSFFDKFKKWTIDNMTNILTLEK